MSQPPNGALYKQRVPSFSPHTPTSTSQPLLYEDSGRDFFTRPRTNFNLDLLLKEIDGRVAVVDACLPPQLADDLRERGISAIWVPAIMGDGASDEEIDRQLLLSDWQLSYFKNRRRVLLTKDVEFYKKIRNRAILVRRHHLVPESDRESHSKLTRSDLRMLTETSDNA